MVNGFTRFLNERLVRFKKMFPLSMTFFLYLLGWGLLAPIFNIHINDVTGSLFLSGIIFSMVSFIRIFFDVAIGLMCDRVNPKKIVQTSLLLYSAIFFLYTLANSFITLLIVRLLQGISAALLWIAGWTLVRRRSKGKHAQEELSAWVTMQDIAYIIGPLVGGFIVTTLSWQPVFYLASLFAFLAFIYASKKIKSPENKVLKVLDFKTQLRSFFKNKSSAVRIVLLTILFYTSVTAFADFLPLHLDNNGIPIGQISIILAFATTIPYIVFPILVGVFSDKYGRKIPTMIGLIFVAFGLYSFTNINSFAQFFFYTFVIYTGASFVTMTVNTELNDLSPKRQEGGFTGVHEMVKDSAFAFGPFLAGLISSIAGINALFIVFSIVALSSIMVLKGFEDF